MKVNLNQIPLEGLYIEEVIAAGSLDLETQGVTFSTPLRAQAQVSMITNAVTVKLLLTAKLKMICSRCLDELEIDLNKSLQLNYSVDKNDFSIDLDPDIRQEVILDYPLKPLCSAGCKGLCFSCGKNLNDGKCSCNKP